MDTSTMVFGASDPGGPDASQRLKSETQNAAMLRC